MRTRTVTLGAATVAAISLLAVPAGAASDTTPPVLTLPAAASFTVGGTLTDAAPMGTFYSWDVPVSVIWSATDASGICGYAFGTAYAGAPTELSDFAPSRSWRGLATDYDGTFGGGSGVPVALQVVARDCAGNTTSKWANTVTTIFDELGQSATSFTVLPVTYRGVWRSASCECWLGDSARKTSARNASVSFQVTTTAGQHVGVVTNTGPDRGAFDIRVDGVLRTTFNAHANAATKKNSVVAYQTALGAGTHTVTLVNRATAGHPRMDVDALLVD